jgi:hypothetical protein
MAKTDPILELVSRHLNPERLSSFFVSQHLAGVFLVAVSSASLRRFFTLQPNLVVLFLHVFMISAGGEGLLDSCPISLLLLSLTSLDSATSHLLCGIPLRRLPVICGSESCIC